MKKAITIASEAVKDMEDKELKLKSYEVILNNLLKDKSNADVAAKISHSAQDTDIGSYDLLAKKLDLKETAKIKDFVEIGEEIRIFPQIRRENAIEEQALFLTIYLSIGKVCFDQVEISSSELREVLARHQIQSINNLSTNAKKISRFIIHKSGKVGSTKTSYRITHEGISYGLSLLKKIIEGENPSKMDLSFLGIKSIKRSRTTSKVGLEISKLLNEGFFDEYKTPQDVLKEVRTRGFFNPRQDIDAYMRKTLLGKKLLRNKINKIWHYVKRK